MQFVKNGPDIPERLLQAHEDGRVALFCGAGISYPAGLPGFAKLVDRIYGKMNETRNALENAAKQTERFDTVISLLEGRIVGGRQAVREKLADILDPGPGASTSIHEALLTLARDRSDRMRLVTTNFDRLFEKAVNDKNLSVERFQAPLLPLPKTRWSGLVYLHGLLPAEPDPMRLEQLVVSSGDFGLAYLTERWAARFVGELLRNYIVCFVGYSIKDPVLRYMTDALAADRLLGESPLEMFAFGSYSKGKEGACADEWKAKNVTPILYREHKCHRYLHETLRMWADSYRDGIQSKERIVEECAMSNPTAITKQDDLVGRMLWALSDSSGMPAKCFAEHDPVPSLDWLEPLCEERYGQRDLSRFGVMPDEAMDHELKFSLLRRPTPYTRAPWMVLVEEGSGSSKWDNVMFQLSRWLLRHLHDPALILWLAKHGGQLHREFAQCLMWHLQQLDGDDTDGPDQAPRAVPCQKMRRLWSLLLADRLKMPRSDLDVDDWLSRFRREGLTVSLRLELRDLMTPRVSLRKPLRWGVETTEEAARTEDCVDWEIVLSVDSAHSVLDDLRESPGWAEALPGLLDDFSALLREAVDLMQELGGADDMNDRSLIHLPSISDHRQNQRLHDWTALIELVRDAWLETVKTEPDRAQLYIEIWRTAPYPVFRRLVFFAAAQEDVVPFHQRLELLLSDDQWWLWSWPTRRETLRLLVALAPRLDADPLAELEHAILTGPPRNMYKDDLEAERWAHIVDREIWLRLVKIADAGARLGKDARAKLGELILQYPDWQLMAEERDEFSVWRGNGEELRRSVAMPRRRRELVEWLRGHPERPQWPNKDDWARRCRDDFPVTACALCALARNGDWPINYWRDALQAWSEEKLLKRSWRYIAPVLANAPDDRLRTLADAGIGEWLQALSEAFDSPEALFFDLCRRVLDVQEDADDPLTGTIHHPIGDVTQALLNWWYRGPPEDGQGLPYEIEHVFSRLCDVDVGKYRHGRVLLAEHVIPLFRVDRAWTEQYLLPLFDWRSEAEACAAWEGFLRSPRLHRSLMEAIKVPFLETARHYETLKKHGGNYPVLLTFAALDFKDVFTQRELAAATAALPLEGLRHASNALVQALNGAGERRGGYWRNRVLPYLQRIWPKSHGLRRTVSENLGKVCIAAEEEFPSALETLRHWLEPPKYPRLLIRRLKSSGLCSRFPETSLEFLKLVTSDDPGGLMDLKECLKQIRMALPELEDDPRFRSLRDILRRSGQELE